MTQSRAAHRAAGRNLGFGASRFAGQHPGDLLGTGQLHRQRRGTQDFLHLACHNHVVGNFRIRHRVGRESGRALGAAHQSLGGAGAVGKLDAQHHRSAWQVQRVNFAAVGLRPFQTAAPSFGIVEVFDRFHIFRAVVFAPHHAEHAFTFTCRQQHRALHAVQRGIPCGF